MATETEIKIRVADMADFRSRLAILNPALLAERHFEDNFVLDYPDGQLRSQACLLRVRKTKERESVTFKGPPKPSRLFKSREELETNVEDADMVLRIFEKVGLRVWFRYQKYREEYLIPVGTAPGGKLQLALDCTPIGDFAELEGSEEGIKEIAAKLGVHEAQFLRDSYYSLYERYSRQQGKKAGYMVFSDEDRDGPQSRKDR